MMLPATVNSCLQYIHTNFSINVGTGTWYIGQLNDVYPKTSAGNTRSIAASNSFVAQTRHCNSYAKTSAGSIKSICLKYGDTKFCFCVGTGMRYFWN